MIIQTTNCSLKGELVSILAHSIILHNNETKQMERIRIKDIVEPSILKKDKSIFYIDNDELKASDIINHSVTVFDSQYKSEISIDNKKYKQISERLYA